MTHISLLLISILTTLVAGDNFTPTAPGPSDSFKAGSQCEIRWTPGDNWKNVTIILMSGSNNAMTSVTTVASGLDGSDASLSPFHWTCPEVEPYSSIYFYQFTNGEDKQGSQWTTRFTITSPSGETTPPEHASQPNGDAIPWGSGSLSTHPNSFNSNLNSTSTSTTPPDAQTPSTSSKKHHHHTKTYHEDEDDDESSTSEAESTKLRMQSKPTASLTAVERQATPTISLPPQGHSSPGHSEESYPDSAAYRYSYTGGQIAGKGHGLSPSMYAVMLVPVLVALLS